MPFHSPQFLRRWLPVLTSLALVAGALLFGAATAPTQAQGVGPATCTLMYAVQNGDTLTRIGTRFSATVNDLYALNPVLRNQDRIFPGLVLCLSDDPNVSLPAAQAALPATGALPGVAITRVNPRQTITLTGSGLVPGAAYSIQMYRIGQATPPLYRVADFTAPADGSFSQTLNIPSQLSDAERIQVQITTVDGQVLSTAAFINRANTTAPVADCILFYTVLSGDTLTSISNQSGVSVQELALLNNMTDISLIFPGQRLCLAAGQSNVPFPPTGEQEPGQATLRVTNVDYNEDVTVRGIGFPRGTRLNVTMGVLGDNSDSLIDVARFTLPRNNNGNFTRTWDIPAALRDQPNLVIRITRADTGQFLLVNFRNVNSSGDG